MVVIVYSKLNCPQCVTTKQRLEKAGIEYEEVRIDLVPEARQMLMEKGHRALPVIYLDGTHEGSLENFLRKMEVA